MATYGYEDKTLDYRIYSDMPTEQPSRQPEHRLIENYDFTDFTNRLRFLHSMLVAPDRDNRTQVQRYLESGCRMFGKRRAFLVTSAASVHRSVHAYQVATRELHDELAMVEEQLYKILNERDEKNVSHGKIPIRVNSPSMTYTSGDTCQYLGVPIVVSGNTCGVLCFLTLSQGSMSPSLHGSAADGELSPDDLETLELMAEGVARMIELQSTQEKNRIEEIRGFATAGVKSLDEYISQARIPEVYGVSGRVVEVLQRRIGRKPLAIDYIAEELNLSKRTLQRRLQQQNVSFAQLRDQVRFHFSIDYLIHQTLSIDAISAALDFSDRTSFTNAFKRWTALSPSTFRKLFRDYA